MGLFDDVLNEGGSSAEGGLFDDVLKAPKNEPGDFIRGLKQYVPQTQQMWGAGKSIAGKVLGSDNVSHGYSPKDSRQTNSHLPLMSSPLAGP